jgi:hypothetical protein
VVQPVKQHLVVQLPAAGSCYSSCPSPKFRGSTQSTLASAGVCASYKVRGVGTLWGSSQLAGSLAGMYEPDERPLDGQQ